MTAHIFGGIQGMTDAQVRQAYADCRARNAKLEEALDNLLGACELNLDDMEPETYELITIARAILAQESTP